MDGDGWGWLVKVQDDVVMIGEGLKDDLVNGFGYDELNGSNDGSNWWSNIG